MSQARRSIESSIGRGEVPPPLWNAARPWSAYMFFRMSQGRSGTPPTREQLVTHITSGLDYGASKRQSASMGAAAYEGTSQGAKQRKKRREAASPPMQPRAKWADRQPVGKGAGGKPRGGGAKGSGAKGDQLRTVDNEGNQLCFTWCNGKGACSALPAGAPCATGRTHKCQICLDSSHPTHRHQRG